MYNINQAYSHTCIRTVVEVVEKSEFGKLDFQFFVQ